MVFLAGVMSVALLGLYFFLGGDTSNQDDVPSQRGEVNFDPTDVNRPSDVAEDVVAAQSFSCENPMHANACIGWQRLLVTMVVVVVF